MKEFQFKLVEQIGMKWLTIGLYVLIVIGIFLAIFLFFKSLTDNHTIETTTKNITDNMKENQRKRFELYNQGAFYDIDPSVKINKKGKSKKNWTYYIDKNFQYSKIQDKFPSISSTLYYTLAITAAFLTMTTILFIFKNIIVSLFLGIFVFSLFILIQNICQKINMKRTENDLTEFLNELKAYSVTTDDIGSCFRMISENLHQPMRDVTFGFSTQVATTGDASKAFIDMMGKLEHPMFKQIVRNLEICTRHSADYYTIADNSYKSLKNFLTSKKKISAQNRADAITFGILIISSIFGLSVMSTFIQTSIWNELLHTTLGNIFLITGFGIIGGFLWNIFFTGK